MNYITTEDGTVVGVDDNGNLITSTLPITGSFGGSGETSTYTPTTVSTTPSTGGLVSSSFGSSIVALPIANFTFVVYANGLVSFISRSIGLISSYFWSFGDIKYSVLPNVLHQYSGFGTFPVTLTVKNSSGESSKTLNVTIEPAPIPEFVDFSFITGSLGVQFTDTSTKAGTRNWNFGDGETSTETSPYHTYASNGIYDVTLTISGISKVYQVVVDRGVRLDWQDNSSDETGFKIERSPNGTSGWTQIATTSAGVNSLLVTLNIHGVDPTAVNYFRVRATNANGDSAYTNIVTSQCL